MPGARWRDTGGDREDYIVARAKTKKTAKAGRGKTAAKRVTKKTRPKAVAKKRPAAKAKRATAEGAAPAMRALARRIIAMTLADSDEQMFALYAHDIESSEAGQPPTIGVDALRTKFAGWRSLTKDTSFEPRRVCVDGNVIMIEWLGRLTLAASGRQTEMHEIAVHEIRDGKIAREAFFYNPAALA